MLATLINQLMILGLWIATLDLTCHAIRRRLSVPNFGCWIVLIATRFICKQNLYIFFYVGNLSLLSLLILLTFAIQGT